MFSDLNFFDYVIIVSGALVFLKRIVEMERYHLVRVVLLTSILSFVPIFFFLGYVLMSGSYTCTPPIEFNDTEHFTCTEM